MDEPMTPDDHDQFDEHRFDPEPADDAYVITDEAELDEYFAAGETAAASAPARDRRWTYDWGHLSRVLRLGWPVLAVLWTGWQFIRYGFTPTEEGLSYAQALRLSHLEIPHADFISNKFVGSALLHLPELLLAKLPGVDLLPLARLVGIAEVMAISILLGRLIFGTRMRDWSPLQSLLVFISALLNLHQMPFTATANVDGLLFALAGLIVLRDALREGKARRQILGALLLGAAVLMRLGFVWTLPIAAVMAWRARSTRDAHGDDTSTNDPIDDLLDDLLAEETEPESLELIDADDSLDSDYRDSDYIDVWAEPGEALDTDEPQFDTTVSTAARADDSAAARNRPRVLTPGALTLWGLVPALAYLAILAPLGALDDAAKQIWKAPWLWGTRFWYEFGPIDRPRLLQFVLVMIGLAAASSAIQRWRANQPVTDSDAGPTAGAWAATAADFAVRALGTYLVVRYLIEQGLEPKGIPPLGLTWVALAIGLLAWPYRGRVDKTALVIAAVSWMSSMSFDYPYPGFVGGSLALLVLWRWWYGFEWPIDLTPATARQAAIEKVGLGVGATAALAALAPTWPQLGGVIAAATAVAVLLLWHPEPTVARVEPIADLDPHNEISFEVDTVDPVDPDAIDDLEINDIDGAELSSTIEPADAGELSAIAPGEHYALAARIRVACAALVVLTLGISLWTFRTARMSFPYLDVSWATQVGQLSDHDDDFGGVKTNAMTHEMIGDLQECREKYPSKWVFVGPENAFLYPLLDLRNPLPLDLFTPAEFKGQEKQLVEMAKERAKDTGILLLAQYSPNKDLKTQTKLPEATPGGANIMDSAGPPSQEVWNAFPGATDQLVACGPFVGKYIK